MIDFVVTFMAGLILGGMGGIVILSLFMVNNPNLVKGEDGSEQGR